MGNRAVIRAVFLDRDGTLIQAQVREGVPHPPAHAGEVVLVPGAVDAVARLRAAGFRLVVVTNQPDVARGTQTRAGVEAINAVVRQAFGLDDFRVCWHDDADRCACRKPKPGLLLEAARDHAIDLRRSFVIGDRWRDVLAGAAAGCRTALVASGHDERPEVPADRRVTTIGEAVDWILDLDDAGDT
jgi:D-glycero-D-manno-heptose 1,7-bisphosphate phosphatase